MLQATAVIYYSVHRRAQNEVRVKVLEKKIEDRARKTDWYIE